MATSRIDIDPLFDQRIRDLQKQSEAQHEAMREGRGRPWMMPETDEQWDGSLFPVEPLTEPFSREELNQRATEAFTADDPGTAADLVAGQTQVEYLACMERAFRMRHQHRGIRARLHAAGRKRGHGNERGVLVDTIIGSVSRAVAEGKIGE